MDEIVTRLTPKAAAVALTDSYIVPVSMHSTLLYSTVFGRPFIRALRCAFCSSVRGVRLPPVQRFSIGRPFRASDNFCFVSSE